MIRQPVQSRNLKSVGYDEKLKILEIEFHEGRIYQYSNVPEDIYSNLMNALSKGTFHHRFIKNNYSYRRIA
jgi:hypothetical protein